MVHIVISMLTIPADAVKIIDVDDGVCSFSTDHIAVDRYSDVFVLLVNHKLSADDNIIQRFCDSGNVKIKKSNELYALADKCIICAGYEKRRPNRQVL